MTNNKTMSVDVDSADTAVYSTATGIQALFVLIIGTNCFDPKLRLVSATLAAPVRLQMDFNYLYKRWLLFQGSITKSVGIYC